MVQDIKGFVYEFCRDQHGSRFIQQKLADASPEELMAVYQEVEPHVIALMQDVFGNYVIQKCFEHGTKVRLCFFPFLAIRAGAWHIVQQVLSIVVFCVCPVQMCMRFPFLEA